MNVTNLVLATDLAVAALDAEIVDRGDHVVVATPSNPDFYWGNYLVLSSPPDPAAVPQWCARSADAFPASGHVALTWDGDNDDGGASTVHALTSAGFALERTLAMTAAPPLSSHRKVADPDVVFRPLVSDRDWLQLVALGFTIQDGGEAFRAFASRKVAARRRACEHGAATGWGALLGDELIASAGIVRSGQRARYQDVQTAAPQRRRGVASALLSIMAAAEADAGVTQLVICVDVKNDGARAAYQQLGFAPGPVLVAACRAGAAGASPAGAGASS